MMHAFLVDGVRTPIGNIGGALADSALAFASNAHGSVTVSVENSIGYPAPAQVGDVLTATCEAESAGRRVGFYRVTVVDQGGRPVAHFRGTVYDTGRPHAAAASPSRPDA